MILQTGEQITLDDEAGWNLLTLRCLSGSLILHLPEVHQPGKGFRVPAGHSLALCQHPLEFRLLNESEKTETAGLVFRAFRRGIVICESGPAEFGVTAEFQSHEQPETDQCPPQAH
jgi:hypothetical protein